MDHKTFFRDGGHCFFKLENAAISVFGKNFEFYFENMNFLIFIYLYKTNIKPDLVVAKIHRWKLPHQKPSFVVEFEKKDLRSAKLES